jgi:flagellar secretion chaperone FliS
MTSPALRDRYLNDSVATASPGRLLVMLYERLVLDLSQAEGALRTGDRELASKQLLHAQEIILELRATLDLSVWEGAAGLAQLYSFLLTELIGANVTADADRVAGTRTLVEPLLDAWRQVAMAATEAGTAAVS